MPTWKEHLNFVEVVMKHLKHVNVVTKNYTTWIIDPYVVRSTIQMERLLWEDLENSIQNLSNRGDLNQDQSE